MKTRSHSLFLFLTGAAAVCTVVSMYIVCRAIQTGDTGRIVLLASFVLTISCPLLVLFVIRYAQRNDSLRWIRDLIVTDEDDTPKITYVPYWLVMLAVVIVTATLIINFLVLAFNVMRQLVSFP